MDILSTHKSTKIGLHFLKFCQCLGCVESLFEYSIQFNINKIRIPRNLDIDRTFQNVTQCYYFHEFYAYQRQTGNIFKYFVIAKPIRNLACFKISSGAWCSTAQWTISHTTVHCNTSYFGDPACFLVQSKFVMNNWTLCDNISDSEF